MSYGLIDVDFKELLSPYRSDLARAIGVDPNDIELVENPLTVNSGSHMDCYLYQGDRPIASFSIIMMPGCCGLAISTGAQVWISYRRRGIGTMMNNIRIDLAQKLKFGALICTDVLSNSVQQRILRKNGWAKIFEFRSPRTGNDIGIDIIHL